MPGTIGRTIGRESVRTIGLLSVMPGTIGHLTPIPEFHLPRQLGTLRL